MTETAKATLAGVASEVESSRDSGAIVRPTVTRRNGRRVGTWRDEAATAGRGSAGGGGADAPSLLLARGATPRDAWVAWLAPHFTGNDSAYFTGTYSDDYGYSNGLMLPRNVHKDFERFMCDEGGLLRVDERRFIVGVERHAYRDILHLHGIIEGPFTPDELRWLKRLWSLNRGHARVLPVQDGCASYVTKYALKGDTDSFEWRLS